MATRLSHEDLRLSVPVSRQVWLCRFSKCKSLLMDPTTQGRLMRLAFSAAPRHWSSFTMPVLKKEMQSIQAKIIQPGKAGRGIDFRLVVMKGVMLSVDLNIPLLKKISLVNNFCSTTLPMLTKIASPSLYLNSSK